MNYDLFEHRHRFAVWAASAAARRGLPGSKTHALQAAIEGSSLPQVVRSGPAGWPGTAGEFDDLHAEWCGSIQQNFSEAVSGEIRYGRAAKLTAVYLKTMIVCGGHHETLFAKVLHPPVDRALLQALSRDQSLPADDRRQWRRTNWTELDQPDYFRVIDSFRRCSMDSPAFWMIERYWQPALNTGPVAG